MVNADNGDGGFYAAINCEGNIHFPTNGVQPTTLETIEYSCANVDNQENSPITEWYMMMMFGVIPFQNAIAPGLNDYIKAVWNADTIQRIICYSFLDKHLEIIANELKFCISEYFDNILTSRQNDSITSKMITQNYIENIIKTMLQHILNKLEPYKENSDTEEKDFKKTTKICSVYEMLIFLKTCMKNNETIIRTSIR
jgi:hypothetical protein